MTTLNVFKRLQTAKVAVQGVKIKESGNNTFAKYTYLELGDFMPHVNTACEVNGICGVINFGEVATLTIVNTDVPDDRIIFSSPMSTAELKGCHAVQNLGAVQTYLRRYLWMMAFDITEHDALDTTNGRDPIKTTPTKPVSVPKPPIIDTIDRTIAASISAELKHAHIEGVTFLEAFGITRLSELKLAQVDTCLAWIAGKAELPETVNEHRMPVSDDDANWPEPPEQKLAA